MVVEFSPEEFFVESAWIFQVRIISKLFLIALSDSSFAGSYLSKESLDPFERWVHWRW